MIAKLKGIVDALGEDAAVIDVGGVGYRVFASARTLGRLPRLGEAVALHIETHVREDHIHLYGFVDVAERDWFRLLLTVQGVGSKVALNILSALSPDDLTLAIATGDKASLSRAQGVGAKLAARLVTELKDKAGSLGLAATHAVNAAVVNAGGAAAEAVSALVNLGYRRIEAEQAVRQAAAEIGEGAETSALLRASLRALGRERAL